MTQPLESDPLPSTLRAAEAELTQRLGEACQKVHVSAESTGELMRLEETLLDAARAAKQAVSVRRKLRTRREAERDTERQARLASAAAALAGNGNGAVAPRDTDERAGDEASTSIAPDAAPDDVAVRNLVDPAGVEWQIWEVTPSRASRTGALLNAYRDGWLAFESVDGVRHRRLPGFPRDWTKLTNLELEALLASAEEVRRKRRTSGPTSLPDDSA